MSRTSDVDSAALRGGFAAAALLGIFLAVTPAAAQAKGAAAAAATVPPGKAQARSYQVAGNRHANAGRWDDAYAEYAIAWQLFPDWQSAADLGKAAYRTKHWAIAAMRLGFYLREVPPARISVKERNEIEIWRADATIKSGSLTIVAPAGAVITIDGEAAGTAPLADPVAVDPGKHEVQVKAGGQNETRSAQLLAGDVRELRFFEAAGSDSKAPDSTSPAARSSVLRPVVVVSGVALTVGGIVAGSVFLAMAVAHGDDKQKAALDVNGRDQAALFATSEAEARNGALWSFVGAGLCAAGTAVLYVTTRSPEKVPVKAAVGLAPGGPSIVIQGRF